MTRLRAPLLGHHAQGRIGKEVVFFDRKGQPHAKKRAHPTDKRSALQLNRRAWFVACIAAWHELTDAQKEEYRLINPAAWPNPAFINFMQEWLVGTVPHHPADHESGGTGEITIQDLLGSPVGPCQNPAGAGADYPDTLKPSLTRYVMPGWFFGDTAAKPLTSGVLYYLPIFVAGTTTYIRISLFVTTADPGSTARLGIYEWDAGLPGALVLDAGTLSTASPGAKDIVISEELTRGYYFLALVSDGTPICRGVDTADPVAPPVPGYFNSVENPNRVIPYATGRAGDVAGGLADPAPAPTESKGAAMAIVWLREN